MRTSVLVLALMTAAPLQQERITFYGIGPVRVGASLADASHAAGEQLVEAKDMPSGTEGCYHVRLESSPTVLFMVEEGRITRVETADPRILTHSGVRAGDSEATARRVYGSRLEVMEHKYYESGHYLVVRSQDGRYALVLDSDGETIVTVRAGFEGSALYVEGCN